ncbi:MAG: poly-gamma-glutamate system protein [Planctomycetota bacterium]|nr:MAG: poly-gamma-glutamate system protein [Planctomycetota bacterium]
MKNVYWRPQAVSRTALILVGLISLGGLFLVENFRVGVEKPHYEEKLAASQLAEQAFDAVKTARLRRGISIDPETDPTYSGLIGIAMSPATTKTGALTAKQTAINPNFAAVVLEMLKNAGVKRGDVVAVGCSGSFPALNICVYAALETLKVRPVIISSATASQWGANHPNFLWMDMENVLYDSNLVSFRSTATSIGGYEDQAIGLPDEARKVIANAAERNRLMLIEADSLEKNIEQRMKIYAKNAAGSPIRAYINVGGGTVSTGAARGKRAFKPGLNLRPPTGIRQIEGIMPQFSVKRIPAIHLVQIADLAEQYGLPVPPMEMPTVGEGAIFYGVEYNRWLAVAVLAVIMAGLYAFVRSSIGFRLLNAKGGAGRETSLEPMV